jgi:hypothetical protein
MLQKIADTAPWPLATMITYYINQTKEQMLPLTYDTLASQQASAQSSAQSSSVPQRCVALRSVLVESVDPHEATPLLLEVVGRP